MSDQSFERALGTWLEAGSDRTPPAAIDAVLLAVKTTPQERDLRVPRRFTTMPTFMRLAAAIAIVAVVGAGALIYANRQPGVGGEPTPTPTPTLAASPTASPTASLLDTSLWVPYTSDRYGVTIAHPADWSEDPAQRDFSLEVDGEPWLSEATESFINPEESVKFSAWSVPVAPGTTLESWMEAYCTASGGSDCSQVADPAVPQVTGDGHPGLGLFGPNVDTMAFFLKAEVVYVTAIWRGETDPSVTPYGGARALLEAFVSTLTLPAQPPQGSPGASQGA